MPSAECSLTGTWDYRRNALPQLYGTGECTDTCSRTVNSSSAIEYAPANPPPHLAERRRKHRHTAEAVRGDNLQGTAGSVTGTLTPVRKRPS